MPFSFSKRSKENLETCAPALQQIAHCAIEIVDFAVLCGYRGEKDQEIAFLNGNSKLHWPESKHNHTPSLAMDLAPMPIDFYKLEAYYHLAGVIKTIAHNMDIELEWAGDWAKFKGDWGHFELKESQGKRVVS